MPGPRTTRWVLGVTSALAWMSVLGEYARSLAETDLGFVAQTVNYVSYFTVVSNLVVAVSTLLFAIDPARTERWAGVLRLAGLVMITITGVVFHLLLASDTQETGLAAVTDLGLHTVVPIVTVVGWLVVGPHRQFGAHTLAWALAVPIAWLLYALARDAVRGEATYPFMDVPELGAATVALNLAVVAVFATVLGAVILAGDRWLPVAQQTTEAPASAPTG